MCNRAVMLCHEGTLTHTHAARLAWLGVDEQKKKNNAKCSYRARELSLDSHSTKECLSHRVQNVQSRARSRLWSLNLKCDDSENVRTPCLILQIHYISIQNDSFAITWATTLLVLVLSLALFFLLFLYLSLVSLFFPCNWYDDCCLLFHPFGIFLIY